MTLLLLLCESSEPGSVPDETTTPEEARKQQKQEEALHASSLRVPRRPPWTPDMSADELNASETQAFLTWRRSLARLVSVFVWIVGLKSNLENYMMGNWKIGLGLRSVNEASS